MNLLATKRRKLLRDGDPLIKISTPNKLWRLIFQSDFNPIKLEDDPIKQEPIPIPKEELHDLNEENKQDPIFLDEQPQEDIEDEGPPQPPLENDEPNNNNNNNNPVFEPNNNNDGVPDFEPDNNNEPRINQNKSFQDIRNKAKNLKHNPKKQHAPPKQQGKGNGFEDAVKNQANKMHDFTGGTAKGENVGDPQNEGVEDDEWDD